MTVYINEETCTLEEKMTVEEIKLLKKPRANLFVVNGYPVAEDYVLKEGDRLVLIEKGIMPAFEELEVMMQARHTPKVYETLKKKKVLVIGLGGLGSVIVTALARVGVGTIVGVDFDIVEPSNLNRQQYFVRHIGMPKTEAMKELVADINPFIQFVPIEKEVDKEALKVLAQDVDLVIEAVDKSEIKAMIVENIIVNFENLPLVAASGMAGYFDSNSIVTKKMNKRFYLCGDGEHAAGLGQGLMAPRVGIAACHEANIAVRLLLGEEV